MIFTGTFETSHLLRRRTIDGIFHDGFQIDVVDVVFRSDAIREDVSFENDRAGHGFSVFV